MIFATVGRGPLKLVAGRATTGLVVSLLLATAPASAHSFSKAIWGGTFRNGVNQFPIYKRLGVSVVEQTLEWSQVAPSRPRQPTNPNDRAYRWPAGIQQTITQANRSHMQLLLQVIFTPAWANGGHAKNWVPRNPTDYANFVTAAARRYPRVHLWMIWGEPTRSPNFQPFFPAPWNEAQLTSQQQIAPHNYARLLDAAYRAIKSVSRQDLVIGGCTYTTGDIRTQQWIANLRLPNGRPPRMDMYAHNPFTFEAPVFSPTASPLGSVQFPDLQRLAQWVDRYLRPGLPLFFSEWTIPTRADQEFNYYVDPPTAAQWVTQALRLLRNWSRIYGLGWIHVYDDPPVSYGGLMTADGAVKPTFWAFARG